MKPGRPLPAASNSPREQWLTTVVFGFLLALVSFLQRLFSRWLSIYPHIREKSRGACTCSSEVCVLSPSFSDTIVFHHPIARKHLGFCYLCLVLNRVIQCVLIYVLILNQLESKCLFAYIINRKEMKFYIAGNFVFLMYYFPVLSVFGPA